MYDDFTFRGRHVREFGGMAFLGDGFAVGDKVQRPEYALPGGGSVIIGSAKHGTISRAVEILPMDGVSDTPAWRRRLLSWLYAGRGFLVWDHDPTVRMTAQFDQEGSGGTKISPIGGVSARATVFGVCEDAVPTVLSGNTAAENGVNAIEFLWNAGSAIRSPLTVTIRPLDGNMTSAAVETPAGTLSLASMLIQPEGTLTVSGEDGDLPAQVLENGILTFAHVRSWRDLSAAPGQEIKVTTSAPAFVTVTGRGKWIVG